MTQRHRLPQVQIFGFERNRFRLAAACPSGRFPHATSGQSAGPPVDVIGLRIDCGNITNAGTVSSASPAAPQSRQW
jgi:hypothetical protein